MMLDTVKMPLKEKMIWLGITVLAVLAITYPDAAARIFWALCEGAAAIKG